MRELNECKAEIFCRMEKGITERKRKQRHFLISLTSMCFLALIVFGISILNGGFLTPPPEIMSSDNASSPQNETTDSNTQKPIDDTQNDTSHNTDEHQSNKNETNPAPSQDDNTSVVTSANDSSNITASDDSINIATSTDNLVSKDKSTDISFSLKANKITSTTTIAQQHFDPTLYTERTLTDEEAFNYLGVNLNLLNINADYCGFEIKNIFTDNNNGNIVYDTINILYSNNITISVSKIGLPYNCIYTLDNATESVFYNPNNKSTPQATAIIGTDGKDFYYADFSYKGINYRVTVKDCASVKDIGIIVKAIIDM